MARLRNIFILLLAVSAACLFAAGSWNGVSATEWNGVACTAWNGTGVSFGSTIVTDYNNPGGSGNRTSIITVSTTLTFGGGVINDLINGNTGNSAWFNNGQAASGSNIRFDFGSGKVIDECTWTQSSANAQGTWQWQGSNDASTWFNIGSSFTLGATNPQVQTSLNGNTTSYRYYQLNGISGSTTSSPFIQEVTFKIYPP